MLPHWSCVVLVIHIKVSFSLATLLLKIRLVFLYLLIAFRHLDQAHPSSGTGFLFGVKWPSNYAKDVVAIAVSHSNV